VILSAQVVPRGIKIGKNELTVLEIADDLLVGKMK
jgi:hypothetical protein